MDMLGRMKSGRSRKGQAVALPLVVLALMVILIVGTFSFEVARIAIARDQLRSATEAAALAGAATLAGSTNTDIMISQTNAIAAATDMFSKNEIFGQSLANPSTGISTPVAGQSQLEFQFLDPSNNNAPVPAGDPKGKALEVKSAFGLPAFAGKVMGLGDTPSTLNAQSAGGVGQLDVVMCFDCSQSMRFNTILSQVKRAWDAGAGKVSYTVTRVDNDSLFGGMRPQFANNINTALRGATDNSLPGNFPPGTAPTFGESDAVVNFNEQMTFTSFSEGGFDFPNVAALVEASRGNLENNEVFQSSGASTTLEGIVIPKVGYKDKYFELARKHTHPWIEAQTAAENFFTLMNNNTRAHFGFVAFSTEAAQSPTQTLEIPNVSSSYPPGGIGTFPLPAIELSAEEEQSNTPAISAALQGIVPNGGTNIGGAIAKAVSMFSNGNSRPNAKRAIILFTDGSPTAGPDPSQTAQLARNQGIAIFAVGLALEPGLKEVQQDVLSSVTNTAGNGSKFIQVTNASKLNQAFASIARNLTQITQ